MTLLEKRDRLLAEHTAQEKYDPYWKAEAAAGRALSKRPIAFLCDDEVVLVGPCVVAVFDGLRNFQQLVSTDASWQKRSLSEPAVAYSIARIKRVVGEPPAELRISQQVWTAYLLGLNAVGLTCCLSDGLN
jgi:hypothetical protein